MGDPIYLAARIKGNSGFLASEDHESHRLQLATGYDGADPTESFPSVPADWLSTKSAEGG